jgi:PEP-CTERM motif
MNIKLLAAAVFSAGISVASSAFAGTVLLPGTGWQYDQVNQANGVSQNSTITITVPAGENGVFSLTDGYNPGDIYRVTVDGFVSAISTFTLYPTPFVNNLGPYAVPFAADWLNTAFSHLQFDFASGTYTLVIRDIHNAGIPAGLGERFDIAIPEASTWAMLGLGFAAIGFVSMTRRRKGSRYAL